MGKKTVADIFRRTFLGGQIALTQRIPPDAAVPEPLRPCLNNVYAEGRGGVDYRSRHHAT